MGLEDPGLLRAHRRADAALHVGDLPACLDERFLEPRHLGIDLALLQPVLRDLLRRLAEAEDARVRDTAGDGGAAIDPFSGGFALRHAAPSHGERRGGKAFLAWT